MHRNKNEDGGVSFRRILCTNERQAGLLSACSNTTQQEAKNSVYDAVLAAILYTTLPTFFAARLHTRDAFLHSYAWLS